MKVKYKDIFALSYRALGANKLRSSLTILGITIGVFSVVGVMTALSAVRQSIDSGLSIFAANVFEISKYPTLNINNSRRQYWHRPNITPRQAMEFEEIMQEEGIPVTLIGEDSGERIHYRDRRTSPRIHVIGTNENYLLTHKYNIAYGRNISETDIQFNRPVIVIGAEVEEELFPNENPIGKLVTSEGNKYSIIGVLEERGNLFGSSLDNRVLIPVTRFVANNWGRWRSMEISAMAPSPEHMELVQDMAIGHFRTIRGLKPGEENDFEITSNDSLQAAFAQIAFIVGLGGLIISGIALLCAGIGIMNIMLVSVTERTREIGLRKSIGARKKDILIQFLMEAIFLSLLGGLVGILLGWGAGNLTAYYLTVPMIIPWMWIGIAVAVCSAIGIGFGFFPALRAARLKPIDALRYE